MNTKLYKTTTLVLGASGATGHRLVEQLLNMGQKVKVIVRSVENLPEPWHNDKNLSIIQASVSDISEDQMTEHLQHCNAVASCLGHNLNLKGLYGKPRRLVTDAVKLVCMAIERNKPDKPIKFVLMNTTANWNRDLNEKKSIKEKIVIRLLRIILPPQADNEMAANFLRVNIGQKNEFIEWVAVRPDGLVNEGEVSPYETHPSPTRSPIFNAGITSRINVGHFMAELITDEDLWDKWKGQMPVIYNRTAKNLSN